MSAGTKPERRSARAKLSMVRSSNRGRDNSAKAPLPLPILLERVLEGLVVEIRPQAVDEIKLGVRALPQQEVAQALLATGADEEIHLGRGRHRMINVGESLGEASAVDAGVGLQAPAGSGEAGLHHGVHGGGAPHPPQIG